MEMTEEMYRFEKGSASWPLTKSSHSVHVPSMALPLYVNVVKSMCVIAPSETTSTGVTRALAVS